MVLTKGAQELLERRYFVEDEETWVDLCYRVAVNISEQETHDIDHWRREFLKIMKDLDFIPNSPTLMNAGTPIQYLSACMVLPVDDSIEGIFESVKNAAIVNQAGAGTGFSFSKIRPEGDIVNSTGGIASGPISFMKNFDMATQTVKQGGRRKGANMGVLRVDHPDIFDFITCKDEDGVFENFNLSVGLTDEFMKALENGDTFDLVNPRNGEVYTTVFASEIWELIVKQAHKNGEPGIVFLDEINRKHPINEEIHAVNVCGEQPLLENEQCTLGAINLSNMVIDGEIAWTKLESVIKSAVRFLDNSIDANKYPVDGLEEKAKLYRKIGLGVMGWAEMLINLGIPYDSEEALFLAEELGKFINDNAIWASEILGAEKGYFPGFDNTEIEVPRRNAVLTTVAPTGSRAQIANTSYGIEPFYDFKYYHVDKDGIVTEFDYDFGDADEEVLRKAPDISPFWHIRMQASWQKHIGSSISKTINLPAETTAEEVSEMYMLAYKLGCKGMTVYRDGSRENQPLNAGDVNSNDKKETEQTILERGYIETAKLEADGTRYKMQTGCGTCYATLTNDGDKILETFIETKNGGCKSSMEAMSRLVSLALRGGIHIDDVVDQLKSVSPCIAYVRQEDTDKGTSCPSAVAYKLLKEKQKLMLKDETVVTAEEFENLIEGVSKEESNNSALCPDCGGELRQASGCVVCEVCGWSQCG